MGAAGDQVPVKRTVSETFVKGERVRKDRHEEGFKICEELGRTLGDAVIRAMDSSRQVSVDLSLIHISSFTICQPILFLQKMKT